MSLKCCSERVSTVTHASDESDQHLEAVRAEILRVASSLSNPVYRYGFEKAASRALSDSFNEPGSNSSDSEPVIGASLLNKRLAESVPEPGLFDYQAIRKVPFSFRRCISYHFFGLIYVERKTLILQSRQSANLNTTLDACQYLHQTSFAFHPALWVIKLGFTYAIRLSLESSYIRGWKCTLEIARPVPDDALLFELCRKGNLAGVKNLLSSGQASVRDVDSLGRTALFVSLLIFEEVFFRRVTKKLPIH